MIRHYRELEEVLPDLILAVDRELVIRYANRMAARLLKKDVRSMTGKYLEIFFPSAAYDKQYQHIRRAFRSGVTETSTGLVRFPGGELFLHIKWVPVRELSGRISTVVMISRDISELRTPLLPEQKSAEEAASVSDREQQVLNLIAEGRTNKEIGKALFISPKTVDVHRTNIMKKLNAHNTAELILRSRKTGLLY